MQKTLAICVFLLLGIIGHSLSTRYLIIHRTPPNKDETLRVYMPIPAQLILHGSDRYLAANTNVFRATMLGTPDPDAETVRVQGEIQKAASFFNPRHEDNYYLASATLAWQGALPQAQQILDAARKTRKGDFLPGYLYAYNKRFLEKDTRGGALALLDAAHEAEGQNKLALQARAAQWLEKADDRKEAVALIRQMAANTQHPALKKYLLARAERFNGLLALQDAVSLYTEKRKRRPKSLDELVNSGLIQQIPHDPTGRGYQLSPDGEVILTPPPQTK